MSAPPRLHRVSVLASIAAHAGLALVATHVIVSRGSGPETPASVPVKIVPPAPPPPPVTYVPAPPAPYERDGIPPTMPLLERRSEDEPAIFDIARPSLVVAAERLPAETLPPGVLTLRLGPARAPSSAPDAGGSGSAASAGPPPAPSVDTFTEPRPLTPVRMEFPEVARRRGWEGVVVLEISVDETGAVATIRVAESSGHEALDEAAVRGMENVRFEPARRNGVPVPHTFRQPVRFALRG